MTVALDTPWRRPWRSRAWRSRKRQPASSLVSQPQPEASFALKSLVKVSASVFGACWGLCDALRIAVSLVALLDKLSHKHAKDFFDAVPVFCGDFVAAVPSGIRAPETAVPGVDTRSLGIRAKGQRSSGGVRSRLCTLEILRDVLNAALKGNPPSGRLVGDHVGLCADDVYQTVLAKVLPQLCQPSAHFNEALLVCNVVAQQRRIRSPVVQFRYRPEPLLPCRVPYLETYGSWRIRIGGEESLG